MADEVFGPILPVMTYENIDDAITFIKSRPKPLSVYLFSESSSLRKKIWSEIVRDALHALVDAQYDEQTVRHYG